MREVWNLKITYICFVDFEKAFDRVNWEKMMKVLQSIGLDWRDRRMISDLYMNQEAVVRIAGGESDSGIIGRAIRQGCPLSPLQFSIYAEMMIKMMVWELICSKLTAQSQIGLIDDKLQNFKI